MFVELAQRGVNRTDKANGAPSLDEAKHRANILYELCLKSPCLDSLLLCSVVSNVC